MELSFEQVSPNLLFISQNKPLKSHLKNFHFSVTQLRIISSKHLLDFVETQIKTMEQHFKITGR